MPAHDPLERHLPLKRSAFQVLAALYPGPRTGFEILEHVDAAGGTTGILGPGTLYRVLRELRTAGLAEPSPPPDAGEPGDGRHRHHRLTPLGRRIVEAEAARIHRTLQAAGLPTPPRR